MLSGAKGQVPYRYQGMTRQQGMFGGVLPVQALEKLLYLTYRDISEKWTMSLAKPGSHLTAVGYKIWKQV
jgi:hypothetical protein